MAGRLEKEAEDPRLAGLVELLARTGAEQVQVRYSDDEQPIIWMAVGGWKASRTRGGKPGDNTVVYEAMGALTPLDAVFRLAEKTIDGGVCKHCQKPSGLTIDFAPMPLPEHVCWYQWDPELEKFRRGCEGD